METTLTSITAAVVDSTETTVDVCCNHCGHVIRYKHLEGKLYFSGDVRSDGSLVPKLQSASISSEENEAMEQVARTHFGITAKQEEVRLPKTEAHYMAPSSANVRQGLVLFSTRTRRRKTISPPTGFLCEACGASLTPGTSNCPACDHPAYRQTG